MEHLKRRLTLNAETYHYTELQQAETTIRIASISPGNLHDDISCELEIYPLKNGPSYEALSYAWGSAVDTNSILVDGKTFRITTSLLPALRRLRRTNEKRLVWIDQLCINQQNDEEKSHQVNLMPVIYRSAKRVIVWLGDEEEINYLKSLTSPLLPKNIEEAETTASNHRHTKLSRHRVNNPILAKVLDSSELSPWECLRAALDFIWDIASCKHAPEIPYFLQNAKTGDWSLAAGVVEGMSMLMKRPWWNRIWVVQETVLAQDMIAVIGSEIIPWSVIERAAIIGWQTHYAVCCRLSFGSLPHDQQKKVTPFVEAVLTVQRAKELRAKKELGLLLAVELFRSRAATDTRDKLFGLLGLVTWDGVADSQVMKPDYSKDSLDVYMKLVISCIDNDYTLHALLGARTDRLGFPSWVPDLAAFETNMDERGRRIPYECYSAWYSVTDARIHGNRLLSVSGIQVGEIIAVGDLYSETEWSAVGVMIQSWRDLARIEDRAKKPYVGGGTQEEAFARCMLGDMFTISTEISLQRKLSASFRTRKFWGGVYGWVKQYIWTVMGWVGLESLEPSYERSDPADWSLFPEWLERIKTTRLGYCDSADFRLDASFGYTLTVPQICYQGRLFLTKSGYMGVGPERTMIGDGVFVLRGSSLPFVLRSSNDLEIGIGCGDRIKESGFTVIGDCYVQGVMDGEIPRDSPHRKQTVWLL